jgi:radical SAM protein with 4Fe4S-binding SPASM domain
MENPGSNGSFYVQWHILDRCNLRCLHCYQDGYSRQRELAWPELRSVADNLLQTMAGWGTTLDLALTGGEPFLKKELGELLNYLDGSRHVGSLSLITNGTIFPRWARPPGSLSKLQEIRVSLDGFSPESHDAIRGKGVLVKVLENIARWQDSGIPVTVMFTLLKRNLPEVPGILEFGKRLGIKAVIIERFFPLGQGETLQAEVLSGAEFLGVWEKLLEQMDITVDPVELLPYRAIRVLFQGEEAEVFGSGCVVAKDGMALLPDGTVLPCRRFNLPLGNLLERSLDRVWHESPVLAALREKHRLKGKCATCPITDCFGCRAMCYSLHKDFLAQDPHCWLNESESPGYRA